MELIRQAIAVAPQHPNFHFNLAVALFAQGLIDDAITAYRRAIQLKPDYAEAHSNLGDALKQKGQLDEAIAACRRALKLRPDFVEASNNLANALSEKGQLDEAIAIYQRTLQLRPDLAETYDNLGNALWQKGRIDEAIAACRRALQLKPDLASAHSNLGNALTEKGQLNESIACYRRALQIKPDYAEAHNNLGNALKDASCLDEAAASYRRALQFNPVYAEAHSNLGNALESASCLDEAIACYEQALALQPDSSAAHNNLGNALKSAGRLDEAIGCYRRAMALTPDSSRLHSNLIYTLHFHPGHDAVSIQAEHERWNRQFAEPLRRFLLPHANDRDPERRLRIGYVSPDFYSQAESYFVVPLFESHDRSEFEIHAYASVVRPDLITERLRRNVDVWHDVLGWKDEALAEKIRQDGIDVLVDLTMHMANNRLPLFARKPAPVQVTWLAYPGSTGLDTIDYRITDAWMDPPSHGTAGYSEESVRLPDSWCCYDPMSDLAPTPVETQQWGRFVRFGSLNNSCKFNEPLLSVWARLLVAVPDSRLLLLLVEGAHQKAVRRTMELMGVEGSRIEFVGKCPRDEYLRLYDQIDIALDPLPYNGITTTCDAAWMGVPVVSLTGKTAAGRAGLSLLSMLGLPELATHSPEECVRVASGLAHDLPRLAALRSTLRERMKASPLMDGPRFARSMEAAYRTMWRKWCGQ